MREPIFWATDTHQAKNVVCGVIVFGQLPNNAVLWEGSYNAVVSLSYIDF